MPTLTYLLQAFASGSQELWQNQRCPLLGSDFRSVGQSLCVRARFVPASAGHTVPRGILVRPLRDTAATVRSESHLFVFDRPAWSDANGADRTHVRAAYTTAGSFAREWRLADQTAADGGWM